MSSTKKKSGFLQDIFVSMLTYFSEIFHLLSSSESRRCSHDCTKELLRSLCCSDQWFWLMKRNLFCVVKRSPCPIGCRARLKRDGTRAETRFGLSEKWTSPFKSAGESVQSTAGSRGVRISGQTMDRHVPRHSARVVATLSNRLFPLPRVTVCHHVSNGLYASVARQVPLDHVHRSSATGTGYGEEQGQPIRQKADKLLTSSAGAMDRTLPRLSTFVCYIHEIINRSHWLFRNHMTQKCTASLSVHNNSRTGIWFSWDLTCDSATDMCLHSLILVKMWWK